MENYTGLANTALETNTLGYLNYNLDYSIDQKLRIKAIEEAVKYCSTRVDSTYGIITIAEQIYTFLKNNSCNCQSNCACQK